MDELVNQRPHELRLTSCLATNTEHVGRAMVNYIGERLQMAVEFVDHISWQERERRLDQGRIQVGWICGLLYVWKAAQPKQSIELLVAPVMGHKRYRNRPIYYSDMIVRRDSRLRNFEELQGANWAYNEPRSYSGYLLVRHHLASLGESKDFFGRSIESGSHLNSLRMVIEGRADASAIDSTLLDFLLQRYPVLNSQIRIVETLGPSPIPPWIVSRSLPMILRQRLRKLLLQMDGDPQGRAILAECQLKRFVGVADRDYDLIRSVAQQASPGIL